MNKKLGYYSYNGLEFESKILACIYATNIDGGKLKWIFNDNEFNNYQWMVEPQKTLDQLYDIRAKQLRDTYDYILISYSGGSDSHNIVSSFIRQKLHIDEIIINNTESGIKAFGNNKPMISPHMACYSEYQLQAIHRLNEFRNIIPNTKITIFDATDYTMAAFSSNIDESWVLRRKETLHPLNITRFNYVYLSDVARTLDKDKKIAIILGVDKPRIRIDELRDVYLSFSDRTANVVTMDDIVTTYTNTTVELFYWAPECCDLLCKQAHTIKRLIEANPNLINIFLSNSEHNVNHTIYAERILRNVLYSTWKKDWFQANKALLDWHSEFDSWFIDGLSGTNEYELWTRGLKYVARYAKKYIYNSNNTPDGLSTFTKTYKIGRLNIQNI